jgi:hypothetical protein
MKMMRLIPVSAVSGILLGSVVLSGLGCAFSRPDRTLAAPAETSIPVSGMNFGSRRFDWSKAVAVHPSIRRTSFAVERPRLMKGSCVRVDLADRRLRFHVPGRAEHWGEPMPELPDRPFRIRTRRQTVRSYLLEARRVAEGGLGLNMLVGVNSTGWSPWEAPWNHKYADNTGLIVKDGEMVAPAIGNPSFIVYKDGSVAFRKVGRDEPVTNIQTAVSGFGIVLTNGVIRERNVPTSLAPRTGFGLSRDKRYLYLFVVDGRQPGYSMGANTYEVAEWLRHFGADDGMNMDGGGSTTLFCWDPAPDPANTDPKSRETPLLHKLNRHAENAERSVACPLGIYVAD